MKKTRYRMTISRLTVDKLGVKLYDRVSAVIAELVANSYDADATSVEIHAPMDQLLATKEKGEIVDQGLVIEVNDNGTGMTPAEVQNFYLVVGAERRTDTRRGDVSKIFTRKVMGRKGVGKLAPFGVCKRIEVLSAGGPKVKGFDERGKPATGHLTAHLILDRSKILSDTDKAYAPVPGPRDGTVSAASGTRLKLTIFDHRRVPTIEEFERQLSQRFGVASKDWQIVLVDSTKSSTEADSQRSVGTFQVETMEETMVRFVHD
ncbi:MAG: ATP-binding protein [Elusimicrobia bacterium]|nr:ATP-binding protein [Elusimicrobiota bacterium]